MADNQPDADAIKGTVIPQNYADVLDGAFPDEQPLVAKPEEEAPDNAEAQSEPEAALEENAPDDNPEANNPDEAELETPEGDDSVAVDLGFDDIKQVLVEISDDEQVSVEDLKFGYMKNADYTQKTQTLSAEKREVDDLKQQYAQSLDFLNEQANQALAPYNTLDWEGLQRNDPAAYQSKLREYQSVRSSVDQVATHRNAFIEQANNSRRANIEKQAEESTAMLQKLIPNWGSDTYSALREYAQNSEFGISPEEFNQVADWRFIAMLNKAKAFDDAASVTKKIVKKPVKSTLKPKTSAPQNETRKGRQKKSLQNLKQSGSSNDLEAFYNEQLGDLGF